MIINQNDNIVPINIVFFNENIKRFQHFGKNSSVNSSDLTPQKRSDESFDIRHRIFQLITTIKFP